MDLTLIKDLSELGAIFILFLVFLFMVSKKLDRMDDRLVKILTFLTVIVKGTTRFNHVENVLGKDGDKVATMITEAENGKKLS